MILMILVGCISLFVPIWLCFNIVFTKKPIALWRRMCAVIGGAGFLLMGLDAFRAAWILWETMPK